MYFGTFISSDDFRIAYFDGGGGEIIVKKIIPGPAIILKEIPTPAVVSDGISTDGKSQRLIF